MAVEESRKIVLDQFRASAASFKRIGDAIEREANYAYLLTAPRERVNEWVAYCRSETKRLTELADKIEQNGKES
jgi:hypothetical protein